MSTFTPFAEKMESAGVSAAAVNAFSRCYEALVSNHSGMIPETDILPADQVEDWQDITTSTPAADKDLISRCVCIKLNGGLGTSMGLQKAKSLLKIKGEDTFLDLIVRQVKHLRSISGTPVRLLLMNSFSTSADTLAYLEKYAADGFADRAEVELLLTFLMETFGRIVREHWEPWQDRLPLHFCSLMALVCFIALWFRTPWACAVAYFGVLTASVQGLITPMLHDGFPSAAFFAFFVGHGLLLISALYLPAVLQWRARPWDDMRALGLCDAYLVLIIPVNIWLDTNYGFTRYAPAGTVLEYFGSAPWYLLTLQIPALVLLRLLYLTVRVRKK